MRQLFIATALLLTAPAGVAAAPPASGEYNDAMLFAYDAASGEVSGYFNMTQGEGPPSFSCIFYLHGKLAGSTAAVDTYFPETPKSDLIKGKLTVTDGKDFKVVLPKEHGGCWNVEHFADSSDPAKFDLAAAHPWTRVAVVKSAKAYFYDAPRATAHRKTYVVKGDGLGVRAGKSGWAEVDYTGGDKPISGWVKTSDLYALP
jgi:hypothetical protein